MNDREKFVATLEATHEFPSRYMFKLIGDNEVRLLDEALAMVKAALPHAQPEISRRESGKGNHQAITMVVDVPSAEAVHDLYDAFRSLSGLRVLL